MLRRLLDAGRWLRLRKLMRRRFGRKWLIRTVLSEDDEEDVAHLPGDSANGGEVVFPSGSEGLVVSGQGGVAESGTSGCKPDSATQVR